MTKLYKYIFLFLLLPNIVLAQKAYYKHFNISNGFQGKNVYCFRQDSIGQLWIGTEQGLYKYDGLKFYSYNSDLMDDNEIIQIYNFNNTIWFVTWDGKLFYIENEVIKLFNPNHILDNVNVVRIYIQKNGAFWILEEDKLFLCTKENNSYSIKEMNLMNTSSFLLPIEHDNAMYFLSQSNFLKYDPLTKEMIELWQVNPKKDPVISPQIHEFYFQNNSIRYIPTSDSISNELLEIFNQTIGVQSVNTLNEPYIYSSFEKINKEKLIFLSEDNFFLQHLNIFFEGDYINIIFEDSRQNIWVGTKNGIYFFPKIPLLKINESNSILPENNIVEVTKNPIAGTIYFCTESGHLLQYNSNELEHILKTKHNPKIKDLIFDDDLIIVGEDITFIDEKNNIRIEDGYSAKSFLKKENIFYFSSSRSLFASTEEKYVKESTKIKGIYSIEKGQNDTLWLGALGGLYFYDFSATQIGEKRIKRDSLFQLKPNESLLSSRMKTEFRTILIYDKPLIQKYSQNGNTLNKSISDLLLLPDSTLCVATKKNGIYFLENGEFSNINTTDGLCSNLCKKLYYDEKDNFLYVSTYDGLSILNPKTKNTFCLNLNDDSFSNNINSTTTLDNNVFIANENGMTILPKAFIHQNILPNKVSIIRARVDSFSLLDKANYSYKENNAFFEYTSVSYNDEITFKYRLLGLFEQWKFTEKTILEFDNLPPNEYILEMYAINSKNISSSEKLSIPFTIHPPFWNTIWFSILSFMALGGLIWWRMSNRFNRLKKEKEKESNIKMKFAELELNALQAHMNPHFIFNALNSIQNYIINNEPKIASAYLEKFSMLMRMFLESSKNKFISLEEEIQLLRLYVDLETLRFSDKISSSFEIEEDLELDIEIPSLLIQPFVENAINHGLASKKEGGHLKIIFTEKDNQIICHIEDDGIGRQRAQELKNRTKEKHRSRGFELVSDRINTINDVENSEIKVEIVDLQNNENLPIGTLVKIIIPIVD